MYTDHCDTPSAFRDRPCNSDMWDQCRIYCPYQPIRLSLILMANGDFFFLGKTHVRPAGSQIIRSSIADRKITFFLSNANSKTSECFSCRIPEPQAVDSKRSEVFFQYDFPVFQYNKRFGIGLLEVIVQGVDGIFTPAQSGRIGCLPGRTYQWRIIQLSFCSLKTTRKYYQKE